METGSSRPAAMRTPGSSWSTSSGARGRSCSTATAPRRSRARREAPPAQGREPHPPRRRRHGRREARPRDRGRLRHAVGSRAEPVTRREDARVPRAAGRGRRVDDGPAGERGLNRALEPPRPLTGGSDKGASCSGNSGGGLPVRGPRPRLPLVHAALQRSRRGEARLEPHRGVPGPAPPGTGFLVGSRPTAPIDRLPCGIAGPHPD